MSICTVLDNNTQKFQDILQDNAAASRAVAWSGNNFDGNNVDTKVNKALSFIDKLKKSTPQTKAQANRIIKELHDKHLVYQVKTNAGIHYGTNFPEIVGLILENKKNVIFSAYGNISDTPYDGKYNYLYSKKPIKRNESFMADFDNSTKKSLNSVGEGMLGFALMSTDGIVSSEKVNQTVDTIVEKIARRVINGENLNKQDIQDELDTYYNTFLDIRDEYEESGSQKGVDHTNSYIDNWDNLEQMVFNALKRRSGLSFKNGIDSKKLDDTVISDEESIKGNNEDIDLDGGDKSQGNYGDNYSLTMDSKAGLSGKLKLFLSTLENGNSHYLTGESLFENFDTVYNSLNAFLAGSEPNINDMIERLKEFQEYEWVKNLIEKLNEAKSINSSTGLSNNMSLVKQFVTAMNKHYIDMSFVQWVSEANGYTLKVMGDNANSRMRVVIADWQQKLEQSNLVTIDEFGRRTFNAQYAKDVLPMFNELFKTGFDSTPQQVFDVLNSIGIRLSYTSIKRLLDGNYQYGKRKFDRDSKDQLFSAKDSHSPISNIYRTIKSISEIDGNVELGEDNKFDVFSNGSVKALASFEAKYSKHLYSNSHRSGTKTVFSYTNDKFIIDRLNELSRGYNTGNPDNFKILEELSKDIFAKDSYWLSQLKLAMSDNPTPEALAFSEAFMFGYLSLNPIKKDKGEATERSLSDMSPQEILAIKLGLLHNNDSKISGRRVGKLFYPTMSDKTNMITIQSLIRDGIKYENGSIDQDTVDYIYDKVVSAEMNRMWEIQKQTNNYTKSTNIEGYDNGSRFFYTIPELNILKSIFKRTDSDVRVLKPKDELTEDNIQEIKDEIRNSLNLMVRSQIEEFKDNKIGNVAGEKNLQYIDSTHANNVSAWYGRKLTNEELSDAVAADFAINYLIHNANIAQMFHGDYAQYFKGDIAAFDKNFEMTEHTIADAYNLIKPTFDNLGKRLAADLAPGYEADFGNKQKLRVTISKDRKMASLAIDYIDKVYRKTSQNRTVAEKAATKAWNDINTSDAQSWTTLDFHIDTLFNFGNKNITEAEYYALKKKIADTKPGEDIDFTEKEWSLILQPTKPLYSNNRQVSLDNDNSVGVRNYIKTSSFPLIPQLVRGTELESVMRVMEKNGIDMHVFESGYKVGATDTHKVGKDVVSGKLKIFNKDGSINENNVNLLGTEGNYIDLDIRGFKIQQEVPYHDHPGEVNRGTQESKLLFSNIKHIGGFKYNGDTYTGEQLEEIYHSKYKEIYQNEAKKLKNELFKKDSNGNPTNELDIEALQKILKEEANGRGYSINDIIGLDINEFDNTFKYPLWALPSAKQYESLIISLVDNRVRKIKLPGNSFVLGSEAGFSFKKQIQSGQKGIDTIRKYQDKIIFTSNFDLKQGSLLPYREDGDGMKPSQVFVPMKLKGSNGEFIDLMKYTFIKDGKLMLDEDRLPKNLLKLFGFRIPTQGHNSMAALEIAGFLPKECGDLIIASQDLVVQMGSDFDVDKLFTYNYLTKEINDNGVPKVVIDNDGDNKLYNDLLDIHLSVFNNNNHELYSLILAPNGFGKLKIDKSTGLSFDIEAIKQKANGLKGTTNYLSPQYQMTKFLNGTSGKMGVGVFSSLSMLNAISQGKGLKYVNVDENGHDSFSVVFGNIKSNGKLGELKTLDGKTYISKVIEAFQSASVDNEKEQILYKLNINKQTVSVINALAMLGFDEEVISYFINQPIIEEYVRRAAERDSSLNKFQESLGGDLFSQIADDYLSKYDGLKVDKSFKNAGVEQLKAQMEINEGIRETIPQDFWGKQLAVLEKFKELNEVGLNLQALMQTVNAESKGLGRTIFGSIDRESKIDNIDSVKEAIEAKKPVTGVLNAGRLLDNTLNGFVADYGTRNLNILGAQIFPYRNKTLLKMFDYASKILERKGDSIAKNEEFMLEMFQAVKSYLFSNPKLFGENFDIEKERKKLFLGESELVPDERGLNKLVIKTPSLAETVNAIKDMKLGQSNALLRALSVDLRQTSSDFKLVKYMASAGQNLDESDLHQAFISLFRENFPISYTINGRQFETTSNELAKDLIKYTYLSGGIQEAIQFTRYIPIEVLDYMGFMDELKTLGNQLNDGTFNNTSDEVGNMTHSDMVEQYLQNNPSKVPIKIGAVNAGGKLSDAIKDIQYVSTERDGKIISRFKANITGGDPKSPGGLLAIKKYVAGTYKTADFIPGIGPIKSKYITVIYKRIGDEFVLIPTLGSFGVDEYTFNNNQGAIAQSAISSRNLVSEAKIEKAVESTGTLVKEEVKSIFSGYNETEINKSKNPVETILTKIFNSSDNEYHADLANRLLNNNHILQSLSKITIFYDDKLSAKGSYGNDLIRINSKQSNFRGLEHLNEVFLHEIIHAYTTKNLDLIFDEAYRRHHVDEFNSIPIEVINAAKKIDTIRRGLIYSSKQNIPGFIDSFDRVSKYMDAKKHGLYSNEMEPGDQLAYGLYSQKEFVTMATSNDKFREDLESLSKQSLQKGSILEKLWNALLEFLGLKNLSQLTKDYVTSEIFQYIETINESKSESLKITQPTKIFDNEKYREVEKMFEEIDRTPSIGEIQKGEITFDKYKYFGKIYEVIIENGIPIGVKDYKGKLVDMQKILNAYNIDPNIDIQNGKPFRNIKTEETEEVKTPQKEVESKYSFTYKGKTIPTEFQLTNGQIKALERLIDFVQTGKTSKIDNLMTLQGYAGTGKTTIIGYLQKYFSRESTFVYMAPTHAATVELSMATSKTGNKSLAMTVASGFKEVRDFSTMTSKKVPSKKLDDRLGYFNNILVIDEVSMLNKKDYETVKAVIASRYKDMKVIFMGDMMQIPEVDANNPKEKQVSLAFSELENVELTEVKRTEDVGILNVLTAIRRQKSDLIPTIPNTDTISYLSQNDFDKKVYFTFKENPENTVMISYTNAGAKAHNKRIRQSLGRTGDLVKDDIIVGFGGYNSKQVENGDIANSIRYTVEEVKIEKNSQNVAVNVMAVSSRLEKLKSLGVGVSGIGRMKYLQLSPNDAFTFSEITRDDMDLNNQFLSKQFEKVLNAKNAALADKRAWPMFFAAIDDLGKTMSKYNVGADYVYNPKTKSMEVYDYNSHGAIVKSNPEMKVEKGVDYGHAITIHKSQGSTVENVFFDSNTLPKGTSSTLMRGQNVVGSEKKSLIYVALSRASKNLYINKVDGNLFYDLSKGEPTGPTNPDADVRFEPGEKEFDLMPEFNEQLIPTEDEVKLLEKMYGKDFMIGYNKLTDVEKQSILKCLK